MVDHSHTHQRIHIALLMHIPFQIGHQIRDLLWRRRGVDRGPGLLVNQHRARRPTQARVIALQHRLNFKNGVQRQQALDPHRLEARIQTLGVPGHLLAHRIRRFGL